MTHQGKTTTNQRFRLFGIWGARLVVLAMTFANRVFAQEVAPFIEDARMYVIESVKNKAITPATVRRSDIRKPQTEEPNSQ